MNITSTPRTAGQQHTYKGHQLNVAESGKVIVTNRYGRVVAEAYTKAEAERKVRVRLDEEDES